MTGNPNKHGTATCANCNDSSKSVHSYKQPASGPLVDSTPVQCLNCGFLTTWGVIKP